MKRFMLILMMLVFVPGLAAGYEGQIVSVTKKLVKVRTDGHIGLSQDGEVNLINKDFLDAYTGRFAVKSVSPGLVELIPLQVQGILQTGMWVGIKEIHKGGDDGIIYKPLADKKPTPAPAARNAYTGKVISVSRDNVTIKVNEPGHVPAGSRVELFFKMSSGQKMPVGQWKVARAGSGTIEAVPVDAIGSPRVGLVAEITSSTGNSSSISGSSNKKPEINSFQKQQVESFRGKTKDEHADAGNAYSNQKNYKLAFVEYEKAAQMGHVDAQRLLGEWYLEGNHVKQDYQKAYEYLKQSADANNVKAVYDLGVLYSKKDFSHHDMGEAFDLFMESAQQGYKPGEYNVGVMYLKGMAVKKDYQEALKWFRSSAEKGFSQSVYLIGYCYEHGKGVSKNKTKAMTYYKKAAEMGEQRAVKKIAKTKK